MEHGEVRLDLDLGEGKGFSALAGAIDYWLEWGKPEVC
jgi:hypothetical protein